MLKKNHVPRYTRPMSSMRRVLGAVELGHQRQADIAAATGLRVGQVTSALYNLAFIGAVIRTEDKQGRSLYVTPGRIGPVARNLLGVRSIFDVR